MFIFKQRNYIYGNKVRVILIVDEDISCDEVIKEDFLGKLIEKMVNGLLYILWLLIFINRLGEIMCIDVVLCVMNNVYVYCIESFDWMIYEGFGGDWEILCGKRVIQDCVR